MKVYSINQSLYAWSYWEKPNSCYKHFVELNYLTLETFGDTLCIF